MTADPRPIEERLAEYVNVNTAGLATVAQLLDAGAIPPGPQADALRTIGEFWTKVAGDLSLILEGEALEFTVNEYPL